MTTVFLKVNYLNVQFSTFSIVNKIFIIISYANYLPRFFIFAFFNFFILSTDLYYFVAISNISFLFFYYYFKYGIMHVEVLVPRAVLQIQSVVRGFIHRKRFQQIINLRLIERVDNPAAIRLQRIFRGYLGE